MDDNAVRLAEALGLMFVGVAVGGVAVLLVVGLLKAGKLPPSVALVISLSILTLVAMVGFVFTLGENNSAELATLAGTGLGALAGAVTATWADSARLAPPAPVTDTREVQPEPEDVDPIEVDEQPGDQPDDDDDEEA